MNRSNVNILGVCESTCRNNGDFVSDRHIRSSYMQTEQKKEMVSMTHTKLRREEMHFGILSTMG